jgi:hypothetical protein
MNSRRRINTPKDHFAAVYLSKLYTGKASGLVKQIILADRDVADGSKPEKLNESICFPQSFWGVERKFLEPLMRFTRGDVRDRIASSKIDHGPSWRL